MGVIDRLMPVSKVLVANDGAWKDLVSGSTVTPTYGISMDPIASGTKNSLYIAPGTEGNAITATIPSLASYADFTIEAFLHFDQHTGNILKLGTTTILKSNIAGYIEVTPPYAGAATKQIDYQSTGSMHIAIACSGGSYLITVNGTQRASGYATGAVLTDTTLSVVRNPNGGVTLGALSLSNTTATSQELETRFLDGFARNTDTDDYFLADTAIFPRDSLAGLIKLDVPTHLEFGSLSYDNTAPNDVGLGLILNLFETYSTEVGCYTIEDISAGTSSAAGLLYVRIPQFATGAARGLLHLESLGRDSHSLRFTATNTVEYVYRQFQMDSNGFETSFDTTSTVVATPIANSADIMIGFMWDGTDLCVVYNGTKTVVKAGYYFEPAGYRAYIGVNNQKALPYHASKTLWDGGLWEVRLWNATTLSVVATSYGPHTFFMSSTAEVPVMASGSFSLNLPVWIDEADENIRRPYYMIGGSPSAAITEVITT